jgi:predicted DNA-binding transcriptional regulator AlpA
VEYVFILKYSLSPAEGEIDSVIERLGAFGCDDALVGTGIAGKVALEFIREAPSALEAIRSALENVRDALPGAKLIEVAPDFVGLTDVADTVGVSRQNMRKLWLNPANEFPSPVHEGSSAIWHLHHVLTWFARRKNDKYHIESSAIEVAGVAMQINLARQATQALPEIQNAVLQFVEFA